MPKSNITIVGAGAVGLEFAARIVHTGAANVTVVAKEGSERLNAVQNNGATVIAHSADVDETGTKKDIRVPAGGISTVSDVAQILAPQDYIIIAVKGQDITKDFVAATITPLLEKNPKLAIVMAQNGIPVWFNQKTELEGKPFQSIDPDGEIAESLHGKHVIGMVLRRITNYMDEPGVVTNATRPPREEDKKLIIGTPDGRESNRLKRLNRILNAAGISTEITPAIRETLVYKLMLNIGGCVAAVAGESLDITFNNEIGVKVVTHAINEAKNTIKKRYGIELPEAGRFIEVMSSLTGYEPSIFKDIIDGKPTERQPILNTVADMRFWVGGGASPVLTALSETIEELERQTKELYSPDERRMFVKDRSVSNFTNIMNIIDNPDIPLGTRMPTTSSVGKDVFALHPETNPSPLTPEDEYFYAMYLMKKGVQPPLSAVAKPIPISGSKMMRSSSPTGSVSSSSSSDSESGIKVGSYESKSSVSSYGSYDVTPESAMSISIQDGWKRYKPSVTIDSRGRICIWFGEVRGGEKLLEIRCLQDAIVSSINPLLPTTASVGSPFRHHTSYLSFKTSNAENILKEWYATQFPGKGELEITAEAGRAK